MQETRSYLIGVFNVSHFQTPDKLEFNTAVPKNLSSGPAFNTLNTRSFWLHSDSLRFHSLYHL